MATMSNASSSDLPTTVLSPPPRPQPPFPLYPAASSKPPHQPISGKLSSKILENAVEEYSSCESKERHNVRRLYHEVSCQKNCESVEILRESLKNVKKFIDMFRKFADRIWIDVNQPLADTSAVIGRFHELKILRSLVDATNELTHTEVILHSLKQDCIEAREFTRLEPQIAVTSDQLSKMFHQSLSRSPIPERKKDTACPSGKIEGDSRTLIQLSENMRRLSAIPSLMPAQNSRTEVYIPIHSYKSLASANLDDSIQEDNKYLTLVHLGVAQLYATSKPPAISELWKVYEGHGIQGLLTHVWQSATGTFFPYEQSLEKAFDGLKHESLHPLRFDEKPGPILNDREILYSLSEMAGEVVPNRLDGRNSHEVWFALLLGVCCAKVRVNIPAPCSLKRTCIKYIEYESKDRRGCTPSSFVESGDEGESCHGFIHVNVNEADMSDTDSDGEDKWDDIF